MISGTFLPIPSEDLHRFRHWNQTKKVYRKMYNFYDFCGHLKDVTDMSFPLSSSNKG